MLLTTRSAAKALVDQLLIHGADTVFCVPGESYLPVLDALYEPAEMRRVRLISCRQEGGAAFMAEAYGKLTGRPGICFVTRGPGASNAVIGVHTAFHDSTPLILFIGQVARGFTEREAFQEIDFRRMFGPIAKWATQIDDPKRIPELIARAFQLALSGRPGPVVIALPEDMLEEAVAVADAAPARRVQAHPGPGQLAAMRALLAAAERPLLLVGGGDWSAQAAEDIRAFARANGLPAVAGFRAQDIIDNRAAEYVGALGVGSNPALLRRVAEADLLLVAGDRLSEMVTDDYRLLSVPRPQQTLIHVFPEPAELGRVYQPHLPILAGMAEFAAAARAQPPSTGARWAAWAIEARADYEAYLRHGPMPGALDLGEVFAYLRERLPPDAIITNGGGELHRLVPPLFAVLGLPQPGGAGERHHGLWRAGGGGGQGPPPRAHRRGLRRRRLLSDERAGAGDRRSLWPRRRGDRDQQRHVRHHPHRQEQRYPAG